MAKLLRPGSKGNTQVDNTVLRANISKINPVIQSTLRNAVARNGREPSDDELLEKSTINPHKLTKLSNIISNNITAAHDLRQITPYIDKAELVWNTIMLYPNGKQEQILTRNTANSRYKNAKLHDILLKDWNDHFTNDYKIEAILPDMLNDMLWNTGSYALMVLSRPGLDYLINGAEMIARTAQGDVAGNEALQTEYLNEAKAHLDKEFVYVNENGKQVLRARNLGRFVRDPNHKDAMKRVGGLEGLFQGKESYEGNEFHLFGTEKYKELKLNITLTDNPAILYSQRLDEANRKRDALSVMGAEGFNSSVNSYYNRQTEKKKKENKPSDPKATTQNFTDREAAQLATTLYPSRNPASQSLQRVKTQDMLGVDIYGTGIKWHVPSEAVITIHRQGNSGIQEEFIVLVDDDGYFLKNTADAEYYQAGKSTSDSNVNKPKGGSTDSLIANLKAIQDGKDCDFDMSEFAEMARAGIIREFMGAVVSGKGENISITIDEETVKIFLSRMFKQQGVRCLYVPGEAMTYMALRYNALGIGQSLTSLAKIHIARLAALDIADAMANLEGATPHTLMTMRLAKEDPDPAASIAAARGVYFEANPRLHSLLSTAQLSVPQIVDSLRESSLTLKIDAGENTNAPAQDIELSYMDKQNFKPVDPSSRDEVLNKISNYFQLPRSWLDVVNGGENNFQIEALVEHQMVLNQGAVWQDKWCTQITDHERKYTMVNAPFMDRLVKLIDENKPLWKADSKEEIPGKTDQEKAGIILADFFNSLYCELPTPTTTDSTTKLTDKLNAIDGLVKAWQDMSGYDAALPEIAKALGLESEEFSAESIKASIGAVLRFEAFKRFNMPMPFDDIVSEGKGGGLASLVNAIVYQRANLGEFLAKFTIDVAGADKKMIKEHQKKISKALADLASLAEPEPVEGEEGGDGTLDGGDQDNLGDESGGTQDDLGTTTDDDQPLDDDTPVEGEETPDDGTGTPPDGDGSDPAKNDPDEDPFKI